MIEDDRYDEAARVSLAREHDDLTWHLLWCNPRCERKVVMSLVEAGFCAYTPHGRKWSKPRHATGHICRNMPAYTRYVFLAFPEAPDWFTVRRTDGVHGAVAIEGVPRELTPQQVAAVRIAEAAGDLNFNREPKTWLGGEYAIGELLRLTEGPFSGFTGTVVRSSTKRGVDLELMLFGRTTVTTAKIDDVRRAA